MYLPYRVQYLDGQMSQACHQQLPERDYRSTIDYAIQRQSIYDEPRTQQHSQQQQLVNRPSQVQHCDVDDQMLQSFQHQLPERDYRSTTDYAIQRQTVYNDEPNTHNNV